MDKFEYKVRAEEIKTLIAQYEYIRAAEIADTIDWRRVKSVMMLCTVSDLYKINRRYEDARDMLLLAYDRHPGGRTIVYSLCELSIKMEEPVKAVEYYKEFVQVAPRDTGRFVLQYKLYQAQEVRLEERIEVLEELKKKDYREKWAYELAYLYHRVGLASRCVEECDELILWFGEGKYVTKAMELKMLHSPLTYDQQIKYDNRFEPVYSQNYEDQQEQENADNAGDQGYMQEEYPEDQYPEDQYPEGQYAEGQYPEDQYSQYEYPENGIENEELQGYAEDEFSHAAEQSGEELNIQVKTMDVGKYNTINLQKELAKGLKEVLGEAMPDFIPPEDLQHSEIFFGETDELAQKEDGFTAEEEPVEPEMYQPEEVNRASAEIHEIDFNKIDPQSKVTNTVSADTAELVMKELRKESQRPVPDKKQEKEEKEVIHTPRHIDPPKELANVLRVESDGQIGLVMPEIERIEKQITGQLSIEDILTEWEYMKKNTVEKRQEELRQRVMQKTGSMFTEFEASVRDGLLEQLEGSKEEEIISEDAVLLAGNDSEMLNPEEEMISADMNEEAEGDEEGLEYDAAEEAETEQEYADDLAEPEYADDLEEQEYADEQQTDYEQHDFDQTYNDQFDKEQVDYEQTDYEQTDYEQTDNDQTDNEQADNEQADNDQADNEQADNNQTDNNQQGHDQLGYDQIENNQLENDQLHKDQLDSDQTTSDQTTSDQTTSDQTAPDQTTPDQTEPDQIEHDQAHVRMLTKEEKELYAPFIQTKADREQLVKVVDSITLAPYTGNVILTGEEGTDTMTLAKNMVQEVRAADSNFLGKVARISGQTLNKKDVLQLLEQMKNGALIIQTASEMNEHTASDLHKGLQHESLGIIVFMEDTKKAMNRLLAKNPQLNSCFTARMDVEAMENNTLVAFGIKYARNQEYSIDELGVLALHTRIGDLQTNDHAVTIMDVRDIVEEAIRHANKKTLGHFIDILLAKRYDEEDMIILREDDFILSGGRNGQSKGED